MNNQFDFFYGREGDQFNFVRVPKLLFKENRFKGLSVEEGKETKYIILENSLKLNALAIKTLRLSNGDVVELCIDEEMISISKID